MTEPRATLGPTDFVRVAFEIVDTSGLAALTMRSLGDRLGVDPTAVYRHFPSKERLIDTMLDSIIGDAAGSAHTDDDPRNRITSVAIAVRAALRRHPHMSPALAQATGDFPNGLLISRLMIGGLRDLGLRGDFLVRMYQTFEGYILGSSVFDTGGYPDTFVIRQARYRLMNEPEFAEVAQSVDRIEFVTETAFLEMIGVLLDHCERLARS